MTDNDLGWVYRQCLKFGWSPGQIRLAMAIGYPATQFSTDLSSEAPSFGTVFGIDAGWLRRHGWRGDHSGGLGDDLKYLRLATAQMTNFTWCWTAYNNTTEPLGRHRIPRFQSGSPAANSQSYIDQVIGSFAGGTGAGQGAANHGWGTLQDFCSSWGRGQFSRFTNLQDKARRQRR